MLGWVGFKAAWMRHWLGGSKSGGKYANIRKMYQVRDPWGLDSPREHLRFSEMNRRISSLAPDCVRLLEVGCGEGLQTSYLMRVSRKVAGLDISPAAIRRARARCPQAEFHAGAAEDVLSLAGPGPYDVITAFEVLYYSDRVPEVLTTLQGMTDLLLVTSYAGRAEALRGHFSASGWERQEDVNGEGMAWECWLWRRAAAEPPNGPSVIS